tara:strand:- start:215 stop:961 length:747 start_codon:yes stop_codon:yes gene_type:complete
MALQGSGAISMDQMRTEFGISGSISMSQLYRGGSEVPTSVNTTCTVSEVANVLCGDGYTGARANHGNAASPCGATARSQNFGYFRGGVTPSSSISWSDDGSVHSTFFYTASYYTNPAPPETVLDLTFSHTATYHYTTSSFELPNGTFKIGTSSDDDSQVSDTLGSSGSGAASVARRGTFSATAGTPVRISIKLPYVISSGVHSNIFNAVYINTADSSEPASHIRSLTVNTGVPASGTISFSDLYGATA